MKATLKAIANLLAWVFVLPLAYPIAWLGPLDGRHSVFQFGSQLMSLLPGLPGVYLRRAYYRVVLGLESRGFVVEFGTILAQRGTYIGNDVYIGPFSNIGLSEIEDDVLIGSGVDIVSGKHTHSFERTDIPIREQPVTLERIRIGRGAWIGNKAVVLAPVGEGTIVGAGSIVTKECLPQVIIAGNPASQVRER